MPSFRRDFRSIRISGLKFLFSVDFLKQLFDARYVLLALVEEKAKVGNAANLMTNALSQGLSELAQLVPPIA